MNGLLVRVGADLSVGGGSWNGPVDGRSGEFVYVPIPEVAPIHPGFDKPYNALEPALSHLGVSLPAHLRLQKMHLDPDFERLTYGDQGERANQLRKTIARDDVILFYAALSDVHGRGPLVYAAIGLFVVDRLVPAAEIADHDRDINAHSRRILREGAADLIVLARPGVSGRLRKCIPIGEWRNRSYRLRPDVLEEWGGVAVKDGYLQRSARLPRLCDPLRVLSWLQREGASLMQANN